jgi:hypothetical protein
MAIKIGMGITEQYDEQEKPEAKPQGGGDMDLFQWMVITVSGMLLFVMFLVLVAVVNGHARPM